MSIHDAGSGIPRPKEPDKGAQYTMIILDAATVSCGFVDVALPSSLCTLCREVTWQSWLVGVVWLIYSFPCHIVEPSAVRL